MAKIVTNFYSYVLNRAVDITVVIPSVTCPESLGLGGTVPSHVLKEKFPVVYLLHGFGNNHAQWTGYTNVEMYAEERRIAIVNLSAENKAYSKIGGDDFVKFVSTELREFVTNYFPISDKKEDSYIAGLSMGGYGALLHGLTFHEKYEAIGAFSAGIDINPVGFAADPLGNAKPALPQEYDLHAILKNLKVEEVPKIYMACGDKDFLLKSNEAFLKELQDKGCDVTWDLVEGYGHEWRFWDMQVEKYLDWLPRTDYYHTLGKRSV